MILDNIKLPLHEGGEFIPRKTTNVFRIATTDRNQDVYVLDQENIPDGIYRIQNNEISVLITPRIFTPGNGETFTKRKCKRIPITL